MIFEPDVLKRLRDLGDVVIHAEGQRLSEADLASSLSNATVVVGQIDLPAKRLKQMANLRAIFNVEGNFLPNIDYDCCFARGIHVLVISPVFAKSVAETALGMAIDLARGITDTHEAFRNGNEKWGLTSNRDSFLVSDSKVGIVGLGDLGRQLRRLLSPFRCEVRAYDPWLTPRQIEEHDCIPADLDQLLSTSRLVFLFAGSTSDNQGFIGERELALMQPGSVLLVMSRAGIIDFEALEKALRRKHIRAGIDVFPQEPLARDSTLRGLEGIILSSHRSGGMRESFLEIGHLVLADIELLLRGLPPQVCRRAERETVRRMRSRPVGVS